MLELGWQSVCVSDFIRTDLDGGKVVSVDELRSKYAWRRLQDASMLKDNFSIISDTLQASDHTDDEKMVGTLETKPAYQRS